ncbi:MAG: von Willebrand factor type A domain-containing protein [Deltaproteobacteria bacterium]|nr:von Willebrand factor type A domain-containing protein [Deltaproteobacteria bacterium]
MKPALHDLVGATPRLVVALAALWLPACATSKPEAGKVPAGAPAAAEAPAAAAPEDGVPTTMPLPPAPASDFADTPVLGSTESERPNGPMVVEHYGTNPTVDTRVQPVSTFSIDVDTAAYSLARAVLVDGRLPDRAAVRVEEFVNSFRYDYPPPLATVARPEPFSVVAEAFPSPNRRGFHVLVLGLKGRVIDEAARPPANLVFVVDVSGSMEGTRLQMVKDALAVLVERLRADDAVSLVVYGSSAHVVLPPTSGADKASIRAALARLRPEGSTNVQAGLLLGYEMASERAGNGRVTRLILCSDGVANNGVTDADGIFATIDGRAQRGMALTTVGVGMGGYNDVLLERLAVKGQGRYVYVDRPDEARRAFVENLGGALVNIASDVKIQLELDADAVERYRLIGFENRHLENQEFADDRVDAGEIGAGHEVTALYEIKLRPGADRIGWLRVRAKTPGESASRLIEEELGARLVRRSAAEVSGTSRLALVASSFAEKLRGSYWVRNLAWAAIEEQWRALPAELRRRDDVAELGALIARARTLDTRGDPFSAEAPLATMDFDHLPVTRR